MTTLLIQKVPSYIYGCHPHDDYPLTLYSHTTVHGSLWVLLQWRHNGHDGASNHQPHHCLLRRLFGHRSNKTSKLRVTGLCAGNSPGTGEFPTQRASDAEMFPFDDVIMKQQKHYKWNMTRIQGAINKSPWHIDLIIADKSYEAKRRQPQIKWYSINSTTHSWWWC